MINERFDKCITFVLQHEGGYSWNKNDPGGETNMGISRRSYPQEDIKNMTVERVKEIYYKDYWIPLGCNSYDTDEIALAVFDSGVNCGVETVKKWINEIGIKLTLEKILFKRLRRYANLCQKNHKLREFLLGWVIRLLHLWERR